MRRIAATLLLALTLVTARPAHAALGDNEVGMNLHIGDQSFVDAAVDLGATWVRLDANWWVLEPAQGTFDWAALDDGVTRCRDAGLKVFLTLAYTPSWVPRHGDTDAWSGNDVPDGSTEWTDFVAAAVVRYRALGVTHFGLWNEANLGGFWEGTAAEYVSTILVPGAAAVRDACVDCLVLGPDLASVGEWDDWLDDMLASTPLGTFDVFTHHSYNGFEETGVQVWDNDRFFNVLDQQRFAFTRRDLRQLLDGWGYDGEVWISETGYEASPAGDAGEEDLQAIYVVRVLEEQTDSRMYLGEEIGRQIEVHLAQTLHLGTEFRLGFGVELEATAGEGLGHSRKPARRVSPWDAPVRLPTHRETSPDTRPRRAQIDKPFS